MFEPTKIFGVTMMKVLIEVKTVWHNVILIFEQLEKTERNKLHTQFVSTERGQVPAAAQCLCRT